MADVGVVAVTYLTDPWCPWSWAAEPKLRRLGTEFAGQLAITYVIAGMADAGVQPRAWLEAAARSGMPADPRGVMDAPPAATQPAGLAVKAVAEQGDPGPYLRRLREAIFCERRRPDRGEALLELARDVEPALDVGTLAIAFGSNGPVEALGADLARAAGRRAVLEIDGAAVDAGAPYAGWRAAALAAGGEPAGSPLGVEAALRSLGPCATAEVAEVCDLPGPRAPAELWRLALEWRARPRAVLGGELWSAA